MFLSFVTFLASMPFAPAADARASRPTFSPDDAVCKPFIKAGPKKKRTVGQGEIIGIPITAPHQQLFRIDIDMHNRDTSRFVEVRLLRWKKNQRTTRRGRAVFTDRIALGVGGAWKTQSIYPRLATKPGQRYFLEIKAVDPDGFSIRTGETGTQDRSADRSACSFDPGSSPTAKRLTTRPVWFELHNEESEQIDSPSALTRERMPPPKTASPSERPADFAALSLEPTWIAPRTVTPPSSMREAIHERISRAIAQKEMQRGKQTDAASSCGGDAHQTALLHAFLYRASCENDGCAETHAKKSLALLNKAAVDETCGPERGPIDFAWLNEPVWALRWISDSQSLAQSDTRRIRRLLMQQANSYWPNRWRGSFNKATIAAAAYAALAIQFPDTPKARAWQEFGNQVFADITADMESEEDAAHYLSELWFPGFLALAEALGKEEILWSDPRFLALVDRVAAYIAPAGVLPGFGDGSGFAYDSPGLVWLFEESGRRRRSGRDRGIAAQILQFNRERAIQNEPGQESWSRSLDNLAHAWMSADESITPAPPANPTSEITQRRAIKIRPRSKWGRPPRFSDFGPELVSDKLILRSGSKPTDLFAFFSLTSGYRHGYPSLGSLAMLMDEGSVLLTETAYPYFLHQPLVENGNTSSIQRISGGTPAQPAQSAEIEQFEDSPEMTVVWLRWKDVGGWGATQIRRIYFLKNRAIWIRDEFQLPTGMSAKASVAWYAQTINPLRGPNWVNVSQPAPYRNIWRYRNPERHALILMDQSGAGEMSVYDRKEFGPQEGCPLEKRFDSPIPALCRSSPSFQISRSARLEGPIQESRIIDTVIVPHEKPATPAADGDAVTIRFDRAPSGATTLHLEIQDESWDITESAKTNPPSPASRRWTLLQSVGSTQ